MEFCALTPIFALVCAEQLPRQILLAVFEPLAAHLASTWTVVHTYAAHGVERLLMLQKPGDGPP